MSVLTWQQHQPFLQRLAYDLVRCQEDAEDIVHDILVRWMAVQQDRIKDARAYLARMVTNACLDHLSQKQKQFAASLEELEKCDLVRRFREFQLPTLDLESQLNSALEEIHHRLAPLERAVFVLREAFSLDYDAVSKALDKKKEHCRQLLSRAHRKLTDTTREESKPAQRSTDWLAAFHQACAAGDVSVLIRQFKTDIGESGDQTKK